MFYLFLTTVIGFLAYLILPTVLGSSIKPLPGPISDAIELCGISHLSELVTPLEDRSFLEQSSTEASSLSLQIGSIRLSASTHFLTAKTEKGEVDVAVPQLDYGSIRSLHLTKSGEIFALGDQTSYRLKASVHNAVPVLTEPSPLPYLFSETCGLFGRITRSCAPKVAIYSHELEAVFLNGFSPFGNFTAVCG